MSTTDYIGDISIIDKNLITKYNKIYNTIYIFKFLIKQLNLKYIFNSFLKNIRY